jgi:hypothetical protein
MPSVRRHPAPQSVGLSAAPIPRSSLAKRSCSFFNSRTTPANLDIEFPLATDCIKGVTCDSPILTPKSASFG